MATLKCRNAIIAVLLLVLVQLALTAAVSPFANAYDGGLLAPIVLSQLSLLVVWSVFGPGHLALRVQAIPCGVGAIVAIMVRCGAIPPDEAAGEWGVLVSLGLTLLIPLAVLRSFGLRLAIPDSAAGAERSAIQFSIRSVLALMLATGILLALWRLNPLTGHYGERTIYVRDDIQMAIIFVALLISIWVGLADRSLFLRMMLLLPATAILAVAAAWFNWRDNLFSARFFAQSFWPGLPVLIHVCVVPGSLLVLQTLGYRLTWRRQTPLNKVDEQWNNLIIPAATRPDRNARDALIGMLILAHALAQLSLVIVIVNRGPWFHHEWLPYLLMLQQLQVGLLGAWAALGPGRWFVRWPGIAMCLAVICLAIAFSSSQWKWVLPMGPNMSLAIGDWYEFLAAQFVCVFISFFSVWLLGARSRKSVEGPTPIASIIRSWIIPVLGSAAAVICSVVSWQVLAVLFDSDRRLSGIPPSQIAYSLGLTLLLLLSAWTGLSTYSVVTRLLVFAFGVSAITVYPYFLIDELRHDKFLSVPLVIALVAWASFAALRVTGFTLQWGGKATK